jgi:ribonucleoside-diphosphate reductase alpha chain
MVIAMANDRVKNLKDDTLFGRNIANYHDFISWARWYPDLLLDMIKPPKGGLNLHLDQRVFLRCAVRFFSMYGDLPRGASKTFCEVLADILVAILFPNVTLAISAQTKENAADLLAAKWNELTKLYPLLLGELAEKPRFSKGTASIKFRNGSEVDAIANAQSSKGQRRNRLSIEESALLNNALFEDALAPVVEVPRLTVGKLGISDPCELNQQINFFTTAGFKGSDEHARLLSMVDEMENLEGKIVIGANWMLPCWYGRGSSKSQILNKKKNMSPVAFNMNYEQTWSGASDGALVNINKLLDCRVLSKPILSSNKVDDEYYIGVDVARSQKATNNQSSVVVGRVKRNSDKSRIVAIDIVNIIKIPNIMNFTAQAIKVKQIQKQYNAKMVICDGNGLGAGLIDQLLTETIDPLTGESLGCWDTVNDDNQPEIPYSPKILYNLKAQSHQNDIVTTFIDYVDSKKLKLLERRLDSDFTEAEWQDSDNNIRPFIETDAFIEEAANLKLKHLSNGGVTIERVAKKVDKDRVSALIYMLWYIDKFAKDLSVDEEYASCVFVD